MIDKFIGKYDFLSNFYLCNIDYEDISYPSIEHAFQAAKTLNVLQRKLIANISTPGLAKKAGSKVNLRPDWEDIKIDVMKTLLKEKFIQPELKKLLLATGDEKLVEGNSWDDTFWGVCNGVGSNWLGKLLMELRSRLSNISG